MTNREWLQSLEDKDYAKEIGGCDHCIYQGKDDCEQTSCIEQFRKAITAILLPNLKKNFNYRLAIKYGFVEPKEVRPVRFYFEGMRMEQ